MAAAAGGNAAASSELTAPGNDKSELHNMRKNFNQLKASAPDFPRKLFIEKWYAHFRHGIRALVLPGAHSSILGLRVSHLEHGRPSRLPRPDPWPEARSHGRPRVFSL